MEVPKSIVASSIAGRRNRLGKPPRLRVEECGPPYPFGLPPFNSFTDRHGGAHAPRSKSSLSHWTIWPALTPGRRPAAPAKPRRRRSPGSRRGSCRSCLDVVEVGSKLMAASSPGGVGSSPADPPHAAGRSTAHGFQIPAPNPLKSLTSARAIRPTKTISPSPLHTVAYPPHPAARGVPAVRSDAAAVEFER